MTIEGKKKNETKNKGISRTTTSEIARGQIQKKKTMLEIYIYVVGEAGLVLNFHNNN